jgi:MarR family transcriptional regulator, organic hydroperoxide resistance regulator
MSHTAIKSQPLQTWQEVLAPHSLGYRIKIVSQILSRNFQDRLEPYGLTPFHWLVLCCLWQEDGLPTLNISEKLQQVGGTLTGVIDRMEERGVVRRERDAKDRRIWRIWLTEEGKELQNILPSIALQLREDTLKGISIADQKRFSHILDQILANLS